MKIKRLKILIADDMNPRGTGILKKYFYVVQKAGISNEEILNNYNGYDALVIRSIRNIDKDFLKKTGIKVIATCSKGLDHMDIAAAEKYGIRIINSESGNTVSAAEHTVGMILNILKRINLSDSLVREGKFTDYDFPRYELSGKKAGIIGYGRVGSYTGKLLSAFNCKILANDNNPDVVKNHPEVSFRSYKEIFSMCDIITIHIPLSSDNKNLFTGKFLSMMNPTAVLINTSRGEVINEAALIKLIKAGKIYYAGLDVFRNEPDINPHIRKLKNVLLTNHTAGKTIESNVRISEQVAEGIINYFMTKK